MKYLSTVFLITCFGLSNLACAAGPGWDGPDFVATQKIQELGVDPEIGQVFYSKHGNRFEMDSPVGKSVAVANWKEGRCWMSNAKFKIYMEGKIDPKTGDCDADLNFGPASSEVTVGGLMALAPCEGYATKQKLGIKTLSGRKVEQWSCQDARAGKAMHMYDTKLKLVIGEQTRYSKEELINIKFRKVDTALFAKPKGFKQVNKNQFMQTMMGAAMR